MWGSLCQLIGSEVSRPLFRVMIFYFSIIVTIMKAEGSIIFHNKAINILELINHYSLFKHVPSVRSLD